MDGDGKNRPLVVDLDGTLIKTDLFIKSMFLYAKKRAFNLFRLVYWAGMGRVAIKENISYKVEVDVRSLPYNEEILSFLKEQKKTKRRIVLATASHYHYAKQIADYLGLFDVVLATKDKINLSRKNKRDKLVSLYGEKGYDYIGNSHDDIVVWEMADKAYLVNPDLGVKKRAERIGNVEKIFITPR